jgi:5'-3' exoribonuclease 2
MGIPYYFYELTKKYSNIVTNNTSDISNNTDIYCIDFNGLIHPVAQDVIKNYDKEYIEEKIIEKLWEKINYYIDTFKPKQIIICTDGVAPLAKMIQQRKRRYLSVYRNKLDNIDIKWDTNAITPGTEFMTKLNLYIKTKIRYNSIDIIINYSGSDDVGEGEHKIFHKIAVENIDSKIIINGLDADLIILSLLSGKKNIYLMREMDSENTTFLNILELRKAIVKELINIWNLDNNLYEDIFNNDTINLIESYCVACSIMGNDFIPHLLTLNLKNYGLDKLINACKYAISNHGMLVVDGEINYNTLCDIFTELSKNEDAEIFKECENYIKKYINGKNILPSDLYALKNKDPLVNTIYNNPIKWRTEYYKAIFNVNITQDSSIITTSVLEYIKGIYWTYDYYKRRDIDHNWYYPYNYCPTLKDISNNALATNKVVFNRNENNYSNFVNSNIQLLIVLPRESKNLLSEKNKKYMEDISAGLYHMYPYKYKIQTFLKTHLWECCPILPNINLKYILKIINH